MSDLEDLTRLMEADRWIEKIRAQREHLPEATELEGVERELSGLAERLREIEAVRRPARDAFNEAADRASSLRQRRADLERRLEAASVPARELSAMHHELENLTTRLSDAEDTEVALLLDLEPMDELADALRAAAAPLVEHRAQLKDAIRELSASLLDERAHLQVERANVAASVAPALLGRYEEALARSGVSGAARYDTGRCDGCRIALSPLDRDRIRALGEGDFLSCPECGRILLPC